VQIDKALKEEAARAELQECSAIVTGANAGLGFETALMLAERGARVTLACRSETRARVAMQKIQSVVPHARLEVAIVDLGDLDSIQRFSEACHERMSRLDLLCNNAGVISIPYAQSPQGFEMHMATNFLGPFALVGHLLDLLQSTPGSRIVNVSSQGHRMGKLPMDDLYWKRRPYRKFAAYAQSKLAITCYSLELHRRLQRNSIDVIALMAHPGFSMTDVQPTNWLARAAGTALKPLIARSGLVQSAADGARCSLYALTSSEVRGGEYIGPDNWLGSRGDPSCAQPSAIATDPMLAAALWNRASDATGIRYLERIAAT